MCLTSLCWYGPAFGDSDDENISLDNEFGGDMDDPGGDLPDQAGTIPMAYLRYNTWFIALILLMVLTGPGPAPVILGPIPWRWWSWVWARPLDEEKERIWRRGNPQSRLLLLQEYGWRERKSWTIRSPLVFSLFEYLVYLSYYTYYTYFGRVSD